MQKAKKIEALEQKLTTLDNEKEEYRIKYSSVQGKIEDAEKRRAEMYDQLLHAENMIKELQNELQIKKEKYESLGQKEAFIRIQNELEQSQESMVTFQAQRDSLAHKLQFIEKEKAELKTDNLKMCQIIREYEQKNRSLLTEIEDLKITNSSKAKLIKSELKSLQKENQILLQKASESNSDCEKLSLEYKSLLTQLSNFKLKSHESVLSQKEDKQLLKDYSKELTRLTSKLSQFNDQKRTFF